jgi:hypothetical protein
LTSGDIYYIEYKGVIILDYRPTVRYPSDFKKYVDDLFQATHLDRNQIFRASLFFFGNDELSKQFLEHHRKRDCKLPSPLYMNHPNHEFYMNFPQNLELTIGRKDVNPLLEVGTSEQIIVKSKGIKLIVKGD